MKLLLDQNISYRLISKIEYLFPNTDQVKRLKLDGKTDHQIWNYTRLNGYTILTFDGDFCDIAAVKGHPPKIIWLRTGNLTTAQLAEVIISRADLIVDFIVSQSSEAWACLELK